LKPAPVPWAGFFWNARDSAPILFVSGQHLSLEHLFNRPPPEDLAARQVQLHMLVRGQIHRKTDRIFLIIKRHLCRLRR
ncbi:MAG TPA: hypothetical protein VGJ26_00765, partial [Pirellulales bacterium]